jgi:DnaJ-class molecular chaperone
VFADVHDDECPTCTGTGTDPLSYCEIATGFDERARCPACDGTGEGEVA